MALSWIHGLLLLVVWAVSVRPFSPSQVQTQWRPTEARRARHHVNMMAYDVNTSPNRWAGQKLEPGFGGIWPGDPNAKTFKVTVMKNGEEVASMDVPEDRYIYFAFEDAGTELPLVNGRRMCRNGCCTTCAAKVTDGKVKQEAALGLLKDLKKQGYALLCCSLPRSDITCELQEEDQVYSMQWGDTFESGGVEWGGFLPEED